MNSDNSQEYGIIFYSHDKKDNKVPLATMSLKADELKRATLIDREYSRILTGIARECDQNFMFGSMEQNLSSKSLKN